MVGEVRAADCFDCLANHYKGSVTRLNLWDVTEADLSAITADEVAGLAHGIRKLAGTRKGGKTAIVFDTLHDFGLGRMLQSLMEIAGLTFETYVCRRLSEARQWLGVGGATNARIDIGNDNKTAQRTPMGNINADQSTPTCSACFERRQQLIC